MRRLLGPALLLVALGGCKRPPDTSGQLPYVDDFDRAELGPAWFPSGGDWRMRDGAVYSSFANNAPLFLNVSLPADVVIEVDVLSETRDVDSKIELMTDGRTHQSGYVFIFGGWSNKISCIARLDEHGKDRKEKSPTGAVGERWYRWRIEKKGGELRWLVDGQPYLSFSDPEPLDGPGHDRLAFGNWQNQIRFDRLRIWAHADAPPPSTRATTTATTAAPR